MKNALYVLAASILGSALALCWAVKTAAPAAAAVPEDPRAEIRAQIRDMVLAREVIPADYLRYLDEDLAAQAEEYNAETANLKSQYTVYAKEQIHSLFQYYRENEPERLNYFTSEELICEAAAHMARCALYRNAQSLFYEDPAMAYALSGEEGGSGALWAAAIHQGFQVGGNLAATVETYLDQVDAFIDALDGAAQ
ncbi:hypothetical protein [uncultured Oscillibacter sp.]|uniref:hypothetical protein n=1 Tax=uncultured Oscillibacter sp. TaxID=876091 RepID=UPI0025F2DF68|nr:hypothetical protein [uncultured Oscillibacter sp.]